MRPLLFTFMLLSAVLMTAGCNDKEANTTDNPSGDDEITAEPNEAQIENASYEEKADPKPKAPRLEFEINSDGNKVRRRNENGEVLWSKPLVGYVAGFQPPHILADRDRVYITHIVGLTALDVQSGAVVWGSSGPNQCMCLSGNLLLAADCGNSAFFKKVGRRVMARSVETGATVFSIPLPDDDSFQPSSIQEMAGWFVVQTHEAFGGEHVAILFDREGRVHHRFDRRVIAGKSVGQGRVFLTGREVMYHSPDDEVSWIVAFKHDEFSAGGGIVDLSGGDMLAFLHCRISDSGVQVIRFNSKTGRQVWQTACDPLGTSHSAYHHWANVRVDEGRVKVSSRGSHGDWVEYLVLRSGTQLKRFDPSKNRK
jgi:hypothetical protein